MSSAPEGPYVRVAVEGRSDTGMVAALLAHVGLTLASCLVRDGASNLDQLIPNLAQTTRHDPWIVFRDSDNRCPVELREELIGSRAHGNGFELRIACSMTEAWLLADRDGFATFFKVPVKKLPQAPDSLPHAKKELLRLCQTCRSPRLRADVVRADGGPGPLYPLRVNEFARERWDVSRAQDNSPSLARAVERLRAMREELSST
ncbi:hypothetical protein [Actinomyces howellii]|uniref:DUF4276 family protein n=1 Tax=Actinomyces howellii TaxID=52771 RepID=A0A3S4V305_9ACTO|nr:hypothetical protein [Actinomyces howellii]VEG25606.1 Uncharacterised protein [Actinomyces howellii]